DGQLQKLAGGGTERDLQITLGLIPRRLGKGDLELDAQDLTAADAARSGWDPAHWSIDVAARVLTLCQTVDGDQAFADRFVRLCSMADAGETVALYSGLPLYPAPELLEVQVGQGLRTNMRAEFEAIAHRNPYPRERFDQHRWNHMVLKALFIGTRLAPIQGLDERANPELARILCDYAHERWAAGRPVTAELWRCVGPFAEGAVLADLERVLETGDSGERQAAALALHASRDPRAQALLKLEQEMAAAIASGELNWNSLIL
ncbi:MAG: EboA domain-containing protein, partial [Gammaproteobacteria bacterium]|nr:EboA domain-containing protein [Gammaproteobacteria bacterium]